MSVQDLTDTAVSDSEKAVATAFGVDMVMKPKIHIAEPDEYHVPQELYVKKLINSPVEFGTSMIPVAMEDGEYPDHLVNPPEDMKTGWVEHFEIDIAMHPHLGAMICGYVGRGRQNVAGLKREQQILEANRQVLLKELEERWYFEPEQLQPVGLFIAAPGGDKEVLLDELDDENVAIFTGEEKASMPEQIMTSMLKRADDKPCREDWQYFVAVVRGLGEGYTSSLEWLRIYDLL